MIEDCVSGGCLVMIDDVGWLVCSCGGLMMLEYCLLLDKAGGAVE
jgi:hypothetical protein